MIYDYDPKWQNIYSHWLCFDAKSATYVRIVFTMLFHTVKTMFISCIVGMRCSLLSIVVFMMIHSMRQRQKGVNPFGVMEKTIYSYTHTIIRVINIREHVIVMGGSHIACGVVDVAFPP